MVVQILSLIAMALVVWASPLLTDLESRSLNGVVSFPLSKRTHQKSTISTELISFHHQSGIGGYYFIPIEVGTPPQKLQVLADTGSSDFWLYGPSFCAKKDQIVGGCFNESLSTTAKNATGGLKLVDKYGGGASLNSYINGTFITDTVVIGGETLKDVNLAVASPGSTELVFAGVIGLSFDFNEDNTEGPGTKYPTVLDVLFNRGVIKSHTYSLYLDDLDAPTGSLLFGGYDTAKYTGPLVPLPIYSVKGFYQLSVPLLAVAITNASGARSKPMVYSTPLPVLLDSGTPLTAALSNETYQTVLEYVRDLGYSINDTDSQSPIVDCGLKNAVGSIDVTLTGSAGHITIQVPFSEVVILENLNATDQYCVFGINNQTQGGLIFGDPFMRSMYIVYDLDNNIIAVAQAKFGVNESAIVPIGKQPRYGGKLWY